MQAIIPLLNILHNVNDSSFCIELIKSVTISKATQTLPAFPELFADAVKCLSIHVNFRSVLICGQISDFNAVLITFTHRRANNSLPVGETPVVAISFICKIPKNKVFKLCEKLAFEDLKLNRLERFNFKMVQI